MIFFPLYAFFEFAKYSTESMYCFYSWTEERTFLIFSETKAPLPCPCGNPAMTLSLDSISEGALGMLSGTATEARHIWRPSMRMTSPLEPTQHKPRLQELVAIFGQKPGG